MLGALCSLFGDNDYFTTNFRNVWGGSYFFFLVDNMCVHREFHYSNKLIYKQQQQQQKQYSSQSLLTDELIHNKFCIAKIDKLKSKLRPIGSNQPERSINYSYNYFCYFYYYSHEYDNNNNMRV